MMWFHQLGRLLPVVLRHREVKRVYRRTPYSQVSRSSESRDKELTVHRFGESHKRPPLITYLLLAAVGSWIIVILAILSFNQIFDAYWYLSIPRIVTTINMGQL